MPASGMSTGNTSTLGYAADALVLAGDLDGAERQLDQAMELIQRMKERAEPPNILLLYSKGSRWDEGTRAALVSLRATRSPSAHQRAPISCSSARRRSASCRCCR